MTFIATTQAKREKNFLFASSLLCAFAVNLHYCFANKFITGKSGAFIS
jgi:hypothetical protein